MNWNAGQIGLDHEFNFRTTYLPTPALVQFSTPDRIVLVDLLQKLDLSKISAVFDQPNVRFICHDLSSEIPLLLQVFGKVPINLVDTQLAKSFVQSKKIVSYASLVQEYLDVVLDKEQQVSRWLQRPLTKSQIEYASADTEHLIALWQKLEDELHRTSKAEWFEEEVCLQQRYFKSLEVQPYTLVKHANRLDEMQYSFLQDLFQWREKTAARLDRPRQWIMKDAQIMVLARKAPSTARLIKRSLREVDSGKWFNDLLNVWRRWERRIDNIPYVVGLGRKKFDRIFESLRDIRNEVANNHQLFPDLLLRKKQTVDLVESFHKSGEFPDWFGKWRSDILGAKFKKALTEYIDPLKSS